VHLDHTDFNAVPPARIFRKWTMVIPTLFRNFQQKTPTPSVATHFPDPEVDTAGYSGLLTRAVAFFESTIVFIIKIIYPLI